MRECPECESKMKRSQRVILNELMLRVKNLQRRVELMERHEDEARNDL